LALNSNHKLRDFRINYNNKL